MAEDPALSNPMLVRTASDPASTIMGAEDEKLQKSEQDLSESKDVPPADIEKRASNEAPPPTLQNPFLVEFDGPNDRDNPKSWTTKRRWAITISMGLLVFTVTFASSIFSVNIGVVQRKFNVDLVTATLGVTLFVLVRSTILSFSRSDG